MSTGLIDLPRTLFDQVDALFSGIVPAGPRIVIWAVFAGGASMLLYWLLSPQEKIREAKCRALAARRQLNDHAGDFSDALPLIGSQLSASFRQIGLVLPATLISALPVLSVLVWMETAYTYMPPARTAPTIEVSPPEFNAQWTDVAGLPVVVVKDTRQQQVAAIPVTKPIREIAKQQWWNWLVGNPLGYLPDDGSLERVTFGLSARSYLPVGPEWARSWVMLFIPSLLLTSLAIFRLARMS